MTKNWKKISTVNDNKSVKEADHVKSRREKLFRDSIHNMKSLEEEDLKKLGDKHYAEAEAEKTKLLAALNDNRLKNKDAIKRAIKLKKDIEAAEKKAAEKKAKKEAKEKKASA